MHYTNCIVWFSCYSNYNAMILCSFDVVFKLMMYKCCVPNDRKPAM